jgi:hypothetical protein
VQVWLLPADLRKADDPLRELRPLPVWVVEGREPVPPAGVEPLHWVLVTTQEVTDLEGAARVLGYYRRRWGIEDLSLVLKSGLQAERLQMDDADTLKNTLALLYVVAWRVLYVRDLARLVPEAPAETLVNPTEQAVLEAAMGRPLPTVGEVVHAIATLGGFSGSPSAGPPGVRTLWDGLQRLEGAVLGWRLAQRQHAL